MKKIVLAALATVMSVSSALFAKDADLVVRYGAFGQGNVIVNGHGDDAAADVGGGLSFEYGMPFSIFGLQNGLGVHASISPIVGVKDPVKSGTDIDALIGYWVRIPFGTSDFAFQPEISYGLIDKSVKAATNTSEMDQLLQVGLSFRWNPLDVAGGKLDFEFTPQFGIETFDSPHSMYIGARLGILYIWGMNGGTADRIAARENRTVAQTAKEIENDPDLKGAVSVYRSAEGVTICLDTVNFKPDSTELEESEYKKLDKVVSMLQRYNNKLHIVGHCAKIPGADDEEDMKFSKERAQTVADYLIKKGARSHSSIKVEGKGSSEPRADNDTEEGRIRNRRVEVTIVRKYK